MGLFSWPYMEYLFCAEMYYYITWRCSIFWYGLLCQIVKLCIYQVNLFISKSHQTKIFYCYTSSSSSSGPGAYAPDAPQPIGLLCDPEPPPPWFRRSYFRHQVPPQPYDARDPSSKRWNCERECWLVILPKCRFTRYI